MHNRRHFLGLGIAGINALFISRYLMACRQPSADFLNYELFIGRSRLRALRELYAEDPMFQGLRLANESFDREAERKFITSEVRYNDHLFDIARLGKTIQNMSFHFLMTEDVDSADLAVAAIKSIMKFPKWDYFLEAGNDVLGIQRASSSVVAVALACDWLGGHITAEEREEWIGVMGERGCEACFRAIRGMRYPDQVVGWSLDTTSTYLEHRPGDIIDMKNWPHILDKTNLKAVPASALTIGAIAYVQQFGQSEQTERWLEQAVFSIESFRDLFAPDGSYNEGISYANYTTTHLIQAIDLLQRFREEDHYDIVNWAGYVEYLYGLSMATDSDPYGIVNISDAGTGVSSAVPFFIARQSADGSAKWFGERLAREHNEWSLAWFPPDVSATPPPAGTDLWHSDLDWIVARTGYTPDDLVVAMRSGGPSNHEHADRNSIMVKCFGEKLIADPYRPPYSYSDPSWILRTTVGHSAVLIDGNGHQYHDGSEGTNASDAVATIVSTSDTDEGMVWTSDATPAYKLVNPGVELVSRTVAVIASTRTVVVVDKVVTSRPSEVTTRFFADNTDDGATIEIRDGSGFRIKRPGARADAVSFAVQGTGATTGQLPIPVETAAKHPFVDVVAAGKSSTLLVTAIQPAERSSDIPLPSIEIQDDGRIVVMFAEVTLCTIDDSRTHPVVELSANGD